MTPHQNTFRNGGRLTLSVLALLCASSLLAQEASSSTEAKTPPKEKVESNSSSSSSTSTTSADGTVKLSPFTVTTDKDQGYYAENTLAGSRLNSNLADLGASITVVTKQQMEDTASVDINDVFRFEANTEGSDTYTPQIFDRGTAKDQLAGYSFGNTGSVQTNATANRIRGLGVPDMTVDFYPVNNRLPFDIYNTQSVEISRGPNSTLSGLGSPAGIVNQTRSQASLQHDANTVQMRIDSNGSERASLAINRVLIKDKLGIYAAILDDNRQFARKPSFDYWRRKYLTLTYKPFSKTTLRGSVESILNNANRPNFLTPRDFVTPWLQSGRPAYDPTTRTITILDTGVTKGPITTSSNSPGYVAGAPTNDTALTSTSSPFYTTGIFFNDSTRPLMRLDDGSLIDWMQRQPVAVRPANGNPQPANYPSTAQLNANPSWWTIMDRKWTTSTGLPVPTGYSSYQYSGVSDKGIYDYTKYNTNQSNFSWMRGTNYNLELEQEILPNLVFSAGWLRQDIDSVENNTVSQTTGATLAIDTNQKLPNGQNNPYFGLPFIEDSAPDTFRNPETDDNFRAMLAYELDFTRNQGWSKWLGRHRMFAMWSKQRVQSEVTRSRLVFVDGSQDGQLRYLPNPDTNSAYTLWSATNLKRYYYLASPGDPQATVSHSLGYWGNQGWDTPYTGNINVFNWNTLQYQDDSMTINSVFSDAGSFRSEKIIKTWNGSLQSFWWDNRLVTTVGLRRDEYRARSTTTGALFNQDGTTQEAALTTAQIYHYGNGLADRELVMNRWQPRWDELSGNTKTYQAVLRPLAGWSAIETRADAGSVSADFLRNLGFFYNKSDNFNPPANAQTDIFFKPLPKPTGQTEEYGVQFAAFNNKLVGRVNWFTTQNQNERTGSASTLLTRLLYGDTTLMLPWASSVVRIRHGADPINDVNWNNNTANPMTDAMIAEAWGLMKLPVNYYAGLSQGATQSSEAKGVEVQITYNPVRNWTMKLTGAKQETIYNDVAPQYDAWLAVRKPVWDAATAPDIADFTDANGTSYSLKNFWQSYGYSSAARLTNTDGNTSAGAYFANVVESQVALAKALQGLVAPNQRKYHASFLTNYMFDNDVLRGWSLGGSERWESKAAVGFLGKAADPTQPNLINASDPNKPVYDNGNFYTDLWIAYTHKIFSDRVNMKLQLNIRNAFENGGLQPIAINWDGSPWAYRIVDPRVFEFTASFDF